MLTSRDLYPNKRLFGVNTSQSLISSLMSNSGWLLTIYPTSPNTAVKVCYTVGIKHFDIAYKHLFIVLIRIFQQPSIHWLRGGLNCHLIWCLFKHVVILLCSRSLIASLISFTAPMKFVPFLDCIMLTCPLRTSNLRNDRIKESVDRSLESLIWIALVLRHMKMTP